MLQYQQVNFGEIMSTDSYDVKKKLSDINLIYSGHQANKCKSLRFFILRNKELNFDEHLIWSNLALTFYL